MASPDSRENIVFPNASSYSIFAILVQPEFRAKQEDEPESICLLLLSKPNRGVWTQALRL
jgi:hypothetical protein